MTSRLPRSPTGDQQTPADGARSDADHRIDPRTAEPSRPGPRLFRWLAFLLVIAISVVILAFRDELAGLGAYGYPGLFLINLFSSATLILPLPGLALAFAAGGSLDPRLVGLAVGCGSTLGELTGYLAGYSGRGVVEDRAHYEQMRSWMARYGLWVLFVLSLVPNPLFDIAGITAGALRIPAWKFLLASGAGKIIKAMLTAYAGASSISLIELRFP